MTPDSKNETPQRVAAVAPGSASGGLIGAFLYEYAALVRRTGIYVDRECGLAMPIPSDENEMETPEEHIKRLYCEERLPMPNISSQTHPTERDKTL